MVDQKQKPYVPENSPLLELTIRAVILGLVISVILGAANAYLGLKAGLTVSATFPAAVVAMAAMRLVRGSILEENIARTIGSSGEALVAGAIFTLPAFLISGAWDRFHYIESTLIMLIGGVLGILFIIILRRPLVAEGNLPFPESIATAELVKAGQKGATGAYHILTSLGIAGLVEFFKNSNGLRLFSESASFFIHFKAARISLLGQEQTYRSGLFLETPSASPALLGVGFIVGSRIGSVLFAGAVMGWFVLVPLGLFLQPELSSGLVDQAAWMEAAVQIWRNQVRPLAVGSMIVAAFHTLWGLRNALLGGIARAIKELELVRTGEKKLSRLDTDLNLKKIGLSIALCSIPMFALYYYSTRALFASALLTIVMLVLGFLLSAVGGYLAATIGGSNSPISGLTLSALVIASLLMVLLGVTGTGGVVAVLTVAGVVCCAAGMAGDLLQDLKIGQVLGGTPWRMEIVEIGTVVISSFILVLPIMVLHEVYGIGGKELPAPQASLMALLAKGVVSGQMPWALVILGMLFSAALILLRVPSPMLVAVGMYLPFFSTSAIFVGGILRGLFDRLAEKKNLSSEGKTAAENTGVLFASGMVAGEALMAVFLALIVLANNWTGISFHFPTLYSGAWPGLLVFAVIAYLLIWFPLRKARTDS